MPNLGFDQLQTTWFSASANQWAVKGTTDGSGGTATAISVYCRNTSASAGSIYVAIYSDTSTHPVTRLMDAATISVPGNATAGWRSATISLELTAGTTYWVAFYCSASNIECVYDAEGATDGHWGSTGLPATWSGGAQGNSTFSIYATYAPATPTDVAYKSSFFQLF